MRAPWDFGLAVQMRDINEDGFPTFTSVMIFRHPTGFG